MNHDPIPVALVQHAPVFGRLEPSLRKARELVDRARQEGASLVVFPETWLPGYPVWLDHAPGAGLWDHRPSALLYRLLFENAVETGGEAFGELADMAADFEVVLVMGAHERRGNTLYNTQYIFDGPSGRHTLHRKLMPTYTERLVWGMGDGSTLEVADTGMGRIGGLICWEHWMPLARAAMHARGEILHVAQWPWAKELHLMCSRHYAFEGRCFVAVSGGFLSKGQLLEGISGAGLEENDRSEVLDFLESIPGGEEELLLRGGSTLVGPDAACLAEPVYGEETLVHATAHPPAIAEEALYLDADGHYSRPDVFRLSVDTMPREGVRFVPPSAGTAKSDPDEHE